MKVIGEITRKKYDGCLAWRRELGVYYMQSQPLNENDKCPFKPTKQPASITKYFKVVYTMSLWTSWLLTQSPTAFSMDSTRFTSSGEGWNEWVDWKQSMELCKQLWVGVGVWRSHLPDIAKEMLQKQFQIIWYPSGNTERCTGLKIV